MVQIYQNEELNDIVFEVEKLDEWKELAGELGMEEQLKFIESAESPLPYPWMNTTMKIIFETLCPCKVEFKKYDKTPIPLEVMKQISLSVRDRHFQEIQVWYDDKSPDPAVIGMNRQFYCYDEKWNRMKGADRADLLFPTKAEATDYATTIGFPVKGVNEADVKYYLIARWADVVRPINELKELAKERLLEKYAAQLKKEVEEKTLALKNIKENIVAYLNGEITEYNLTRG